MVRAYVVLMLILTISIFAYAQDEMELPANGNDVDDYLFSEGVELWEQDLDWEFYIDLDVFCDILLDTCLDLELADEDMYEIFPDLWEPDYEFYPFWEDEWLMEDFDQ